MFPSKLVAASEEKTREQAMPTPSRKTQFTAAERALAFSVTWCGIIWCGLDAHVSQNPIQLHSQSIKPPPPPQYTIPTGADAAPLEDGLGRQDPAQVAAERLHGVPPLVGEVLLPHALWWVGGWMCGLSIPPSARCAHPPQHKRLRARTCG